MKLVIVLKKDSTVSHIKLCLHSSENQSVKILMVSQDFVPKPLGGIGRHVEELVDALRRINIDTTILTFAGDDSENSIRDGVIRIPREGPEVPGLEGSRRASPIGMLQENICLLGADISMSDFDLVHSQDVFVAPACYTLAKRRSVPLILTKHFMTASDAAVTKPNLSPSDRANELYFHRYAVNLEAWAIANADRLITVSDGVQKTIISRSGDVAHKCKTIVNGTNIAKFRCDDRAHAFKAEFCREDEKLLILVGRVAWKKGGDVAIRALSMLDDLTLHLLFVGCGDYKDELERMADDLGIKHKVTFAGYREGANLAAAYQAADAVLVPSRRGVEGFPIVVAEALSLGKLVIASDVFGIAEEQIRHGHNGLLVEPDNPHRLAESIRWALDHSQDVEAMKTSALANSRKFSWTAIAQSTVEQYNLLVRR